jgi:putative lipoic acid-binding regulatory protein
VGVVGVQFQVDGANSGAEDTAAPYSASLDTTKLSNGSHSLTAIARDAAGNRTTSTAVTVNVSNTAPDTTPPAVSITAPAAGATVSATIAVTATASDNVGVVGVQFQVDGANSGAEDTAAPYSASLDTTKLSNGNHSLAAIARDAAGNRTTSATVTVNVSNAAPDTTPPAVSITTPAAGATVSATIAMTATASDNVGVVGVQFQVDGANSGAEDTAAPYSASLDTTKLSNSNHSLAAIARDAAGNRTTSTAVMVNVSNTAPDTTPPAVSITTPAAGATVSATIAVTATASDNVGVVGVQFQVDGANSGAEDTAAPYALFLDTTALANGSHSLTAVARDAAGNRTTSAAAAIIVANTVSSGATGPLRVLASNPRYFTDGSGKAIYLTGSHTWANLVDQGTTDPPSVFDYTAYLNFLVAHNHNFFRLWTWTLPHANDAERPFSKPLPWPRVGPGAASDGKPQFDLNQFDQTYFDRLRARVIAAGQNGIYVSIMLFEGYDLQFMTQSNDGDPFASGNNVNGISCSGTCPHTLPQNAAVTAIEQAYLRKVVDTVDDLDNVLYEVANEAGPYSTSWQYSIINYVKQYEATKPKQHPSGMTFQYLGGTDSALTSSPAEWISPVDQLPAPANGSKVVVNDTDHSYNWSSMRSDGQGAQQKWAWENFAIGNNLLFMDPYLVVWSGRNAPGPTTVDPYWEVLRNALGRTRVYAQKMNLAAMTPQGALSSTGFCLANPGSEYLVYQPASGASFNVNLPAGTYSYEWYNPSSGAITATGLVTVSGGNQSFVAAFSGDAVLYLKVQ